MTGSVPRWRRAQVVGDVERLEIALAATAHQRDREEEAARLATEGVADLELRLERLQQVTERERAEAERAAERHAAEAERAAERHAAELEHERESARAALERSQEATARLERELAEARQGLAAKEKGLEEAGLAMQAVERELAAARARLEVREEELERSRASAEEARRELAAVRERLGESERERAIRERDLAARERELGVAGERLATREGHLKTAQLGIESRDRKLEAAGRARESREAELAEARRDARQHERRLALAEARLEKAQQRAEHFRGALVAIRAGRAYRLMRVLWRVRRPFRRAPRDTLEQEVAAEEDPSPPAPSEAPDLPLPTGPEPAPPAPPRVAVAERAPSPRPEGGRLRVAAVLDAMSAACFAPECDLVPLTLDGWREQLDEQRPDLLLVESAWNGNGGEWQYRIAKYPREDLVGLPALRALLDGCRERRIPTAFWNKEDPVHFDRFAEAASLFDHVFTTDARCLERYRALPGERTVAPLPFAAQPRIHNPAAVVEERSFSPCFAGAWYRDRHPDRRRALEALLDAARPYGLVIYDRRFGGDDAAFGFPERFQPHVLGRLPYERILDVYKTHRVFLNANSVVDSPTMCSRRVFELAACDTAILSTPGAALAALLGPGTIAEVDDEPAAAEALERLLGDAGERARRTRAARRAVFAAHTYGERLATIADTAGLDSSTLRRPPFATPSPSGAVSSWSASSNGPASMDAADGATGSRDRNERGDGHPWVLKLLPGVTLTQQALADARAATAFADAGVIGASPARNGSPAVEHRYVPEVDPRAVLVRRELLESRGWPSGSVEQVRVRLREWSDDGVRIYAADADWLPAQSPAPMGHP